MQRLILLLILSFALTLRLGLLAVGLLADGQFLTPDSAAYLRLGNTMAWHGRFARSAEGPAELVRTPGYPLLLAGLMRASGENVGDRGVAATELARIIAFVQVVFDVGLVWLTWRLGRRLCGPAVGLVAAGLQATSPVVVASSVRVLSDGLFALLLTISVLLFLAFMDRRRWRTLIPSAILLATATYVRPISLLLPLAIVLVLLIARRGLRPAFAYLLIFSACIAPWAMRNWAVARYSQFSAIPAVNLHLYEGVAVRAHVSGLSEQQVRRDAVRRTRELFGDAQSPERFAWETQQGRDAVAEHPALAAWLHVKADANSLLPGVTDAMEVIGVSQGGRGTLAMLKSDGLIAAARNYFGGEWRGLAVAAPGVLLLGVLYIGLIIAAVRSLRLHMPAKSWLLLLTALYLLLAPGPASHPRFRVPVMPILAVASAAGWAWLFSRRGRQA